LTLLRERAEALLAERVAQGDAPTDEELAQFEEAFRATQLDYMRVNGTNNYSHRGGPPRPP
jgi:hypothetical protein